MSRGIMNGKLTNCPNCGAPIKHYYNYCCEYCGTFLHNTDEEIKKIGNVNIKLKNIEIERSPICHAMLVTLYAMTIPKANWYEEGIGEVVLSGDSTTICHPIAYRVQMPLDVFYEHYRSGHIEKILELVLDCLPPIFEQCQDEIIRQLVEKLVDTNKRLNIL